MSSFLIAALMINLLFGVGLTALFHTQPDMPLTWSIIPIMLLASGLSLLYFQGRIKAQQKQVFQQWSDDNDNLAKHHPEWHSHLETFRQQHSPVAAFDDFIENSPPARPISMTASGPAFRKTSNKKYNTTWNRTRAPPT